MIYLDRTVDGGAGPRRLRAYVPDPVCGAKDRPAVVVFPGGAYGLTFEGEAEPIALAFTAAGICAFVLDYSVASNTPKPYPSVMREAFSAVRYVRENAERFCIDPHNVAVLGFSAGGHLAACTGTLWNKPIMAEHVGEDPRAARPDKLVLCYPVIDALEPCCRYCFTNLFGADEEITEQRLAQFSAERQVDDETPPAFLWLTAEDNAVPVRGALAFARALAEHGTHAELHLYPHGKHGLCLAPGTAAGAWAADAVRFLRDTELDRKIPPCE
jgi:acetyl esterase/lipase